MGCVLVPDSRPTRVLYLACCLARNSLITRPSITSLLSRVRSHQKPANRKKSSRDEYLAWLSALSGRQGLQSFLSSRKRHQSALRHASQQSAFWKIGRGHGFNAKKVRCRAAERDRSLEGFVTIWLKKALYHPPKRGSPSPCIPQKATPRICASDYDHGLPRQAIPRLRDL